MDYDIKMCKVSNSDTTKQLGWSENVWKIFGCMKPVFSLIGNRTNIFDVNKNRCEDSWEVPFEMISDLEWIGSGAQGAVFSGKINNQMVAIKKVKELHETDVKHLSKLEHENIVKFIAVCTQSPVYAIIMEFCPYGSLHQVLKEGSKVITPYRVVSWSKQIATGMNYLHSNKIIHRDLKSPNILIGENEIIKISDFGTCREWNGVLSTKMSFCGTVAWMAPEIIRNELCSEKVDVWSYAVVLWELLTCEAPYKNFDSNAILFGVGNYSLSLPIPETCPSGFSLLIKQCWSIKPKNRPTFKIILSHLEIAGAEIMNNYSENYETRRKTWQKEINEKLLTCINNSVRVYEYERDLIRKRQDEWKHAKDVRLIYERKLERTNNLYLELTSCFAQLEEREREIIAREKQIGCNRSYRTSISSFRKQHFEKLNRKRIPTIPSDQNLSSSPNSPVEKQMCVQLHGDSTKTVITQNAVQNSANNNNNNNNSNSSTKVLKKLRHRRTGSGSSFTRNLSERSKRLMDNETQTEDITKDTTDNSSTIVQQQVKTISTEILGTSFISKHEHSSESSSGETDIDDHAPMHEDTTSSSQTNHLKMVNSMATSCMTASNFSFDEPIKECSDDDLENLRQKVNNLITDTTSSSSTSTIVNRKLDENMNDNKQEAKYETSIIDVSLRRKSVARLPVRVKVNKNNVDNNKTLKNNVAIATIEKKDLYYADLSSNDDTDNYILNDDRRNNNEI
ncbi:hypothetical protein PVAND_011438 [Polypedilum vanderplanki]|uniref:mitogen-activated protein kinase kinase kinase n=1 Tax=Polypedilum vanderplanki TaxID=319348 RepID=A0A9J6CIK5_POLVA|nr:hypothetical protein PVAND_011438 [Polypedilum vanderplanki]